MFKKILSHTILYGLAPQIPKVASFFVLPIITKDLTTLDYGIAGLVTAYVGGFTVLQSLGVNVNLANSYFKYPSQYKWLWRQLHGFISLWSILFGALLSIILYVAVPQEIGANRGWVIFLNVSPLVFFSTTQMVVFRYYQLSQKPLPIAMRSAILGLITVFLNLYFISYLKMGYMGWFWSSFISSFLGFIFFLYPIYFEVKLLPIFNFKWRLIKNALKVSLPTVPHYYSNYLLNTSDKVVLDVCKVNTSKIGLYNFAGSFGSYFQVLGDAVGLAIGPIYNQLYKASKVEPEKLLEARKLTFLIQIGFFFITFLICLWLKEIFIMLVNNDALRGTYGLAIIIIMGYNYRPMYLGAGSRIYYEEKTNILWKISFIAGLGNVVLNFIFIPIWGIEAAAVITFISLMYMGYSGFFLRSYKDFKEVEYYPVYWLLSNVLITIIVYLLRDISYFYKMVTSIFLILGLILVFLKANVFKKINLLKKNG